MTIPDKFYHYRRRAGSITGMALSARHLDGAEAFYDRYRFLKKEGHSAYLGAAVKGFAGAYLTVLKDFSPKTAGDKARLKQVSAMGCRIAAEQPGVLDRKELLALKHPLLWQSLYRIKGKLTHRAG